MSATTEETAVQVVTEIPASPIVVVDGKLMQRIATLKTLAADIEVKDSETEQKAADVLHEATALAREVEKARKEIKEPYLKAGRLIDEKAKTVTQDLESSKAGVRKSLNAYQAEQERIRREEERRRQEEARRLEEERQRKEAELETARAAAELPDLPGDDDVPDLDDDVPDLEDAHEAVAEQTQAELEGIDRRIAENSQPAVTARRAAGIAYRKTLVVKSADVSRLPDRFVIRQADTAAIRKEYCVGWDSRDGVPQVPGVEFEVKQTPVSSGRR